MCRTLSRFASALPTSVALLTTVPKTPGNVVEENWTVFLICSFLPRAAAASPPDAGLAFSSTTKIIGPPFTLYKMKCQFSDRRVSTSLRPGHGDGNGILDSLNHRCPDLLLRSGATES